ncbi:MAG: peptidylprolyl isomerase [Planctomycetes bacterium]|nr:peptidylprolyl isomerase [Planctomycetota bacterium]
MKSFLTISTCFVMILTVCGLVTAADKDKKTPEPATSDVAVTVNGIDITETQLEIAIAPQLQKVSAQLPPQFIEQFKAQMKQQALEKMIVEQLLDETVKAEKIIITDKEVDTQIEEMAAKEGLSIDDFKELVKAYGQSIEQVQNRIRQGLSYQKLMETQMEGKVNVKEEGAKKFYEENKSQFETPEQIRASHILIQPDSDPNADPDKLKAKAEKKAKKLLKKIKKKKGANFAELAKENSACSSAAQGGDLSYFGKGQMVPAFDEVAFGLKVGEISGVVETKFGYHIIMVTDHNDASTTSYAQAKDGIMEQLKQQQQQQLLIEYIDLLKAKAKIVYPPGKEPAAVAPPAVPTSPAK